MICDDRWITLTYPVTGGTVCGCEVGYRTDNDECEACHRFCKSCFGPSNNECMSCIHDSR